MPVSILIPPDNRLLGWSLSDLTLYGAPAPAGDMTIGPAADGGSIAAAPATAPAAPAAPAPAIESDRAADETTALLAGDDLIAPQPSASPLLTPADHDISAAAAANPSVPQPIGSGSFLQAPVVTPLQAASADHGGAPSLTDGVAAAPLASLAAGVAYSLPHAADTVLAAPAAVLASVAATETSVADVLAPVATGLSGVVTDLSPLTAPVEALDPVGTVDTVVADLGTTEISPAGTAVADLAGAALDATPLSAFAGSDPAAGVQTLIGMMDSGEAFDLGHLNASDPVQAEGGSILDALAADEAPAPLLGDHHDDAVHSALDDHGVHLGI